jgi:uncharacterized RDD family membrane protein YckC
MLDPELTRVLKRRILAFAIDFGLVGLLTLFVGRSRLLRFPISERDPLTGEPIYSADQFVRLSDLAQSFNRKFEYRDQLYVIDSTGLLITVLVGLILALIIFVLLPANTSWSPGKKLLGLRVSNFEGVNPSVGSHFVRNIVGLIDLLPVVIPGLVGWLTASKNDFHQRIGDRVAQTLVVDDRRPNSFIDPAVYARQGEVRKQATAAAEAAVDTDDVMVDLDGRLGGVTDSTSTSSSPDSAIAPDNPAAPTDAGLPLAARGATTDFGPVADLETHGVETQGLEGQDPTLSDLDQDPEGTVIDAADIDFDLDDSLPSRPSDHGAPEREDLFTHSVAPDQSDGADAIPPLDKPTFPPPPVHRGATGSIDWEQPVAEPSPVWRPEASGPSETSVSSMFTSSDETSDPITAALEPTASEPTASAAATGSDRSAVEPTWNEEWQAWLFWDQKRQRWLRHDADNDRWIPIS